MFVQDNSDGFVCGPMGCHGFFGPGMMGNSVVFNWIFIIFWIIFWVLAVVALVALIRWLWRKGDGK
ncbi:MAG: hypothetical protein C4584_02380 [Armatimonadetes bacterium]|nr:MAG: hypothetical protein C4584_02380 [Armatimonadota bacterium]